MTTKSQITIQADEENAAEVFWCNLDECYPKIADELRRGRTVVNRETWETIQKIEGFSGGPLYAPEALIEVK